MRYEPVPFVFAEELFQMVEEREAFLIRDATKSIIRILALEIGDELGELMFLAKKVDAVAQSLPPDDGGEVPMGLSVDGCLDTSFEIDCPAFIEPEVLPGSVRYQVAGPRVRQFVCNNVDILTISGDDGRSCVRCLRVFHATWVSSVWAFLYSIIGGNGQTYHTERNRAK